MGTESGVVLTQCWDELVSGVVKMVWRDEVSGLSRRQDVLSPEDAHFSSYSESSPGCLQYRTKGKLSYTYNRNKWNTYKAFRYDFA